MTYEETYASSPTDLRDVSFGAQYFSPFIPVVLGTTNETVVQYAFMVSNVDCSSITASTIAQVKSELQNVVVQLASTHGVSFHVCLTQGRWWSLVDWLSRIWKVHSLLYQSRILQLKCLNTT